MPPGTPKAELVTSWMALLLVCGEFSIALFDLVWDGKALALFMAVNALMRETKGGQHYHDIVVRAVLHWRPTSAHAASPIAQSSPPGSTSSAEASGRNGEEVIA